VIEPGIQSIILEIRDYLSDAGVIRICNAPLRGITRLLVDVTDVKGTIVIPA
jgi:hypothetical protein